MASAVVRADCAADIAAENASRAAFFAASVVAVSRAVRRVAFAVRIASAKAFSIATFDLLYVCNAIRYALRSAEFVFGADDDGTVVVGDEASSASAAVAPLDMTRAIVVTTSVFFANCFMLTPLLGAFLFITINNEIVEIL